MGKEFNGLVYNNQYYIYGFKIPKELYSKIKHKCDMWYKESQKLQQENQQLKEQLKDEENWRVKIAKENSSNVSECLKLIEQKKQYKSVLDEIREYINNTFTISSVKDMYKIMDGIEEILDKVKEC